MKTYKYRTTSNDNWEVYSQTEEDGVTEEWVATVSTETVAKALVAALQCEVGGKTTPAETILYMEVRAPDYCDTPGFAKVTVDQEFIKDVAALHFYGEAGSLSEARAYTSSVEWIGGEELRLRGDELVVAGGSFWFTAHPKHADYSVETIEMGLQTLMDLLQVTDVIYWSYGDEESLKALVAEEESAAA